MAIMKLTKSGKGLLFIDDDGRVYNTSINYLLGLINGRAKYSIVTLSRLPFDVPSDKFPKSPVYNPDGIVQDKTVDKTDRMSKTSMESQEAKKLFMGDDNIW